MKVLTAVTVALAMMLVAVQALTEEQKMKMEEHHKVCAAEAKVGPEIVKRLQAGDFEMTDPKAYNMVLCVLKRTGMVDDKGDFQKDVALAMMDPKDREAASKAIDACLEKKGADNAEIGFNYAKCYYKLRPKTPAA